MPPSPHLAILEELITMGTEIARMVHAQALRQSEHAAAALPPRPAANDPVPDPTLAFDRIARTVRRCIALHHKLAHPEARPTPADHRIQARTRILREVEDAIQLHAEPEMADHLRTELRTRLDAPDLEDEIDTRPVRDIIQDICHDLSVVAHSHDNWSRRTPADIAALRQRAAALPPGWSERPRTPPPPPSRLPPRQPEYSGRPSKRDPVSFLARLTANRPNTA